MQKVNETQELATPTGNATKDNSLSADHAAKLARIEELKAGNRAMMRDRCYECGAKVQTGNFIESGNQRYCFPCAAKGADAD
jgi:hypothetical protein